MALTANLTGRFAGIKDMVEWRINKLLQLGMDFSLRAPHPTSFLLDHLPPFRGHHPAYEKGILFVNGTQSSKGEVLLAFLKHAQLQPKKILFVDDRKENLESVELALQGQEVAFQGFHFVGAQDYPSAALTAEEFEARWRETVREVQALN